jgi:chitinase
VLAEPVPAGHIRRKGSGRMKSRSRSALPVALGVALALMTGLLAAPVAGASPGQRKHVIVGYFADWAIYGRGYFPKDIPANRLTHINYAFATPTADGKCGILDPWADYQRTFAASESVDGVADDSANPDQHLFGNFNQLRKLKAANSHLKIMMSIGGWSDSVYFSDVAATAAAREKFVNSCIDMLIKGNLPADPVNSWPPQSGGPGAGAGVFDGIDVDWEYPVCCGLEGNHNAPADRHNATLLFRNFRDRLDAVGANTGHRYLLTAAIPSGYEQAGVSYQLVKVTKILNWINVMAYDFHGTWEDSTNHNSPFTEDPADPSPPAARPYWNTVGSINWFRHAGVPARKLVVGMPFYANQYIRVPNLNHGLYQPYNNDGMDQNEGDWATTSSLTYHDLVDVAGIVAPYSVDGHAPRGLSGYTRLWNAAAGEPYLWNSATQRLGETVGSFISYDDPRSLAERARFIKEKGLRGAMFWELSNDDNAHDLLNSLASHLH